MQLGTALYLTRPQDVSAHLIYAAAEIGAAVLTVHGRQVHGQIGTPDPETGQIPFSLDRSLRDLVEAPPPGRAVRVTYEHADSAYAFYTEVDGSDIFKCWILQQPRTVERTDRRLVFRHQVEGEEGFSVMLRQGVGEFPLRDISSAGVSFDFGAEQEVAVGDRMEVELHMPGQSAVSVTLEIRNCRAGLGERHIAGACFVGISHLERAAIARSLAVWKYRKRRAAS